MAVAPYQVSDGDFSIAWVNGTPEISYPFIKEADNITWEWKARLRIDQASFGKQLLAAYTFGGVTHEVQYVNVYGNPALLQVWQTPLGPGYLIDMGPVADVGSGLYEFPVTITGSSSSAPAVPVNRLVGRTMTYTFKARVGLAILWAYPTQTLAQVLTEYSLAPFPVLHAPTVLTNFTAQLIAYGDWNTYEFNLPGQPAPVPGSAPIFGANVGVTSTAVNPFTPTGWTWPAGSILIGQDSKCDLYKGGIYMRETYFVTQLNVTTLTGT